MPFFSLKNLVVKLFTQNKKIETFTYFVTSPPTRKTGYREKKFDKIISKIVSKGYKIKNIQTQANNNNSGGMWVILEVQHPSFIFKKIYPSLNDIIYSEESDKTEQQTSQNIGQSSIEGLYYIDE